MEPPAFRVSTTGDKTPRHADGLATRARRPRPSERIASGFISGISPEGPLPRVGLAVEGRAPHARNESSPFTRHIPIGRRAFCPIIFGYREPGAYEGSCTAGARSAPLRENRFSRDFRALPGWGPALRSASPRRGGLCTPAAKSLASSRDLPLDQGFSPAPWGKGNPSAFARPCHKAAERGSLAAEPQCSSTSYPGEDPVWMRGSCSSGVFLTHGVCSPSIFQGNFILGSGQGRSCLVP
jgi:hypothetical protein